MNCLVKPVNAKLKRGKIFPLFIPFAGCPFHCIFCAQERQTGTGRQSVREAAEKAGKDFGEFVKKCPSQTVDIAFYGGTFTAVPEEDFRLCLDFFRTCRLLGEKLGIRVTGRCSTRPDCLSPSRLESLQNAGIDLIELGIQSFSDTVLAQSKRGYTSETAENACKTVKNAGFKLGIQLMAGLPGQTADIFISDAAEALRLSPDCLRYYPCLVPAKTPLALLYGQKLYTPWSDKTCIETLGTALAMAWEKQIPVIRLSVAPEKGFDETLLAGPRHPSLGSDIQSYALYTIIAETLALHPAINTVRLPLNFKSSLFGTKKWLREKYSQKIPLSQLLFEKNLTNKIEFFNRLTS